MASFGRNLIFRSTTFSLSRSSFRTSGKRCISTRHPQLPLSTEKAVDQIVRESVEEIWDECPLHIERISETDHKTVFRARNSDLDTSPLIVSVPHTFPPTSAKRTSLAIASEAATMEFVREFCGLSVPKVVGYSIDSKTPGKFPYIITEDVQITNKLEPLSVPWKRLLDRHSVRNAVEAAAMAVGRTMEPSFGGIGSLYFKKDLDPAIRTLPLFADGFEHKQRSEAESKFVIGPLIDRSGDFETDDDCGPWQTIGGYLASITRASMRRLSQYEKDKELLERKTKLHLDDISPVRDLLKKMLSLASRLHDALMATPRNHGMGHRFIQNTLAHPNLIASNILVSKRTPPPEEVYVKGRKLLKMFPCARLSQQTYIDWFGASVRPVFMQMTVPPFVAYKAGVIRRYAGPLYCPSILPSTLASVFSDADRKLFEWHKNLVMREQEWSYAWRDPSDFYEADMHPFYWPLANLPSAVSRVMERHDGYGPLVLRALLMQIHDYWDGYRDNVVDRGPRPFSFTKQEIDRHSAEWNWLIREQGISWLGLEAEAAQERFLSSRYYDDLRVSKAPSTQISM